jgi:acyl-CoA synthetase (AMP-forming)/AMP-acid ligase II
MRFRSPLPDMQIPERSLTSYVLQQANLLASKPALIDGPTGRVITYEQFAMLVRRLAIGLRERGFGTGDVLAIYSPNLPEFAVALHGTVAAGGAVTTINPLATAHDLTAQLNDAQAVYLLTHPALVATALEAAAHSQVREVFAFGECECARVFDELFGMDSPRPEIAVNVHEDVVYLPYSSGTTGLPKGVMLTHHNIVANGYQIEGFDALSGDDAVVAFLPFFHLYGMFFFLTYGLARGATIVTMPRFDLEQYLQLLQDYRSRHAYVVPPVLIALANHPVVERYDLSSLRSILSAAAPASAELCAAVSERLGCTVKQGYGMTELSPVAALAPPDGSRPGASGVPIRNTELRVVDIDTGRDLGPDEHGELWVRGPQVMQGYLNRAEATAETITADGWLKTGDIAMVDRDGYLFIVDRLKELIKVKAYQVPPAELEAVLLTHPAVADAAVIGVPDAEAGELPKAFVVPRGAADPDEIMAFVAAQVAPYKRIRAVQFVDQIPKAASGKILRRALREYERAGTSDRAG